MSLGSGSPPPRAVYRLVFPAYGRIRTSVALLTEVDHLFHDLVDATAQVNLAEKGILVRFQKGVHNMLPLAAQFEQTRLSIPWLGRKRICLAFG